jgi:hypothetical protein
VLHNARLGLLLLRTRDVVHLALNRHQDFLVVRDAENPNLRSDRHRLVKVARQIEFLQDFLALEDEERLTILRLAAKEIILNVAQIGQSLAGGASELQLIVESGTCQKVDFPIDDLDARNLLTFCFEVETFASLVVIFLVQIEF